MNPIEKFFSKLKALLRKAAQRDIDALWKEIGELLNTVSASECTNYFAACGYVSTYIETALANRFRASRLTLCRQLLTSDSLPTAPDHEPPELPEELLAQPA